MFLLQCNAAAVFYGVAVMGIYLGSMPLFAIGTIGLGLVGYLPWLESPLYNKRASLFYAVATTTSLVVWAPVTNGLEHGFGLLTASVAVLLVLITIEAAILGYWMMTKARKTSPG